MKRLLAYPIAVQARGASAVALLLVLALAACGGDKAPGPAPKADAGKSDTHVEIKNPAPAPVAKTVTAEGGTVEHQSGAKLNVPAGALPADVELTMEATPPPPAAEKLGSSVGAALQLGPEGQTFLVPVQIAVPIDPSLLGDSDPALLQVVLAPNNGSDFVGLETTYDAKAHVLLAMTSHFSIAVPVKLKATPLKVTLPDPMPAAKVDEAYGPVVPQVAGGKPPYTWSLAGGLLPPGLALSPDGTLTGTPSQPGKFAPTLRVKDAAGQLLDKAAGIDVDGPPNPVPQVAQLEPSTAQAGSADLPVKVKGSGFVVGALVMVNGKGAPTQLSADGDLLVTLTEAHLAQPGELAIGAVNPPPGGGKGPTIPFVVTAVVRSDAGSDGGGGPDAGGETDSGPLCTPTTPPTEVCDGVDNNCDGKTDDVGCSDGQICTVGDTCKDAKCASGGQIDCEDGNPCTLDACKAKSGCVHTVAASACSDGNPCTVGDACKDSVCLAGPKKACDDGDACTTDACDLAVGCTATAVAGCGKGCSADGECGDDSSPCTTPACKQGTCTLLPTPGACDDGDACTQGDACVGNACAGDAVACDDGKACTVDVCDAKGGCSHSAKPGGPCEDGDLCTVLDTCGAGGCKAGTSLDCNDGNLCTDDACDPKAGCTAVVNQKPCDDGDVCTLVDTCADGTCAGKDQKVCDDGDACTVDSCDGQKGGCTAAVVAGCGASCKTTADCKQGADPCLSLECSAGKCVANPTSASCDDQDACTTVDVCKGGLCEGSAPKTCDDAQACTDDGCDPKSGCTHVNNSAACSDGLICTGDDVCAAGGCTAGGPLKCDDGNPCTVDTCVEGKGCQHLAATGDCDDGNGCTLGETCMDGACAGGVAKPCPDGDICTLYACAAATGTCEPTVIGGCGLPCAATADCKEDGNPCTTETCGDGKCGALANTLSCSDGDPCTAKDTCGGGKCAGTAPACDDGNICTADSCAKDGTCSNAPAAGPCDDANACTVNEACAAGLCKAGSDLDCNDGNACTDDSCNPASGCLHPDSVTPCSDGDPCSIGDACKDAACKPTGPKVCDDGDACTTDACDAKTGSCVAPAIAGCGDNCAAPSDCKDDGNPCTDWACTTGKCAIVDNTVPCDDGSACTAKDTCAKAKCAGAQVDCDDKNPCTDDSCDPGAGCQHQANTAACSDGQVCTAGDVCVGSKCVPGAVSDCDDGNACTFDVCDAKKGCQHLTAGMACSDGDLCTVGDTCQGAVCQPGAPKSCDDTNPCSVDTCDAKSGNCKFAAVAGCGAPCLDASGCAATGSPCVSLDCVAFACTVVNTQAACDDKNACTSQDSCQAGACAGKGAACDDKNPCTADTCNPATGCAHTALAGSDCEDGDLCSVNDSCDGATCSPGPKQQCSDGNPCTTDGCDAGLGCQFAPATASCDDGDLCTTDDACSKGVCLGGAVVACDDGKACTADKCDPKKGCVNAAIAGCGAACKSAADCADDGNPCTSAACTDGVCAVQPADGPCDDGDACTVGDACQAGACAGEAKSCSDGNPCTDDGCDAKAGCTYAANGAPCSVANACLQPGVCQNKACTPGKAVVCDDNNPCTLDDCDPLAGCRYRPTSQPCNDGSACTLQDECYQGVCLGGLKKACTDGDPCTVDGCDDATGNCQFGDIAGCGKTCATTQDCADDGNPCTAAVCAGKKCVAVFIDVPCNDGDVCSAGDVCQAGTCTGTVSACDDGNACTQDSCTASGGCSHKNLDGACDDGTACTTGDACKQGACTSTAQLNCDDGNPCTINACDPNIGCTAAASKAPCSDDNPCTGNDACAEGVCQPGALKACDDAKACTLDQCNPKTGLCTFTAVVGCGDLCTKPEDCAAGPDACTGLTCTNGACTLTFPSAACDDGNACTANDGCKSGTCLGKPSLCDDGSPCTMDACDTVKGCTTASVDGPCDDGNACTVGETCVKGACAPGKTLDCSDANPCTTDGCDGAFGCLPSANKAACDDGNACTTGDHCEQGECLAAAATPCDDENPCTNDYCSTAKGCIHPANTAPCSDGSACTAGDVCVGGKCSPGKPVVCDDGTVCTTDSCDPKKGCQTTPVDGPCSDNSACTSGDTCVFGACLPGALIECGDNNACTNDTCDDTTGCQNTNITGPCSDGDACTVGDACKAGVCVPGNAPPCDDQNACTDDLCSAEKGCSHTPNAAGCSDGNACSSPDLCDAGICKGGAEINCDDKNPCTADSCEPSSGCVNAPAAITCTDGDACTDGDKCDKGDCAPGAKVNCDDGKLCTDDSCDKSSGCVHANNTLPCTDGTECTKGDVCKAGVCSPGAALDCNDKDVCTDDSCDPKSGCGHTTNTAACDDGDACTTKDTCASGKCTAVPLVCDDKNGCTWDTCDTATGCVFTNTADGCSDGDACTAPDLCSGGVCKPGAAINCDDANVCTDDSCDKQKGCVSTANTQACDDGTVCTTSDVCAGGKCGGTAVNCGDNNPCTDDSCDKALGCENANNTKTCSDGDACTVGDACADGSCLPGALANCDDKNLCTDDSCDKLKGCQHVNNTAPCADNTVCTTGDACKAGSCSGAAVNCDDSNACTDDSCDPVKGCQNVANATPGCDDGNACTKSDACAAGACAGAPVTCSDGQACTLDTCVPATGCVYMGSPELCSDGDPCTVDSCDKTAGCKHAAAADGAACVPTDDACPVSATCQAGKCVAAAAPKPGWKLQLTGDLYFIQPIADGYLVGSTNAYSCGGGGKLTKVDKNGKVVWTYSLGSYMRAAKITKSGNIVVAAEDYGNPQTLRLGLIDPAGQELWQHSGQAVWANGATLGVMETSYGFATIYRVTATQLVRWDANGNYLGYVTLNPKAGYDYVTANGAFQDGANFVVSGRGGKSAGGDTGYVMVVDENGVIKKQIGFANGLIDATGPTVGAKLTLVGSVYVAVDNNLGVTQLNTADLSIASYKPTTVAGSWGGVRDAAVKSTGEVYVSGDTKPASKWVSGLVKSDLQGSFKWLAALDGSGGQSVAVDGTAILVGSLADTAAGCLPTLTKVDSCPTTKCDGVTCQDDGITCTVARCDAVAGCVHDPMASLCEDGNPCTTNACDAAKGCVIVDSAATYCDDKNPCTTESCDPVKGCAHANNTLACNDGNACTLNDVCGGGSCAGAAVQAATACFDGNPCTQDLCDPKLGCTNPNVADGTVCTPSDDACPASPVCAAGVCAASTKATWTAGYANEDVRQITPMGAGAVAAFGPAYGSSGIPGRVRKVDRNGVTEWTFAEGGAVPIYSAQPTADGNVVYGYYCNRVGLLDGNGKQLWATDLPGQPSYFAMRAVAVAGGYIGANNGSIMALDTKGTVAWKIEGVSDGAGHGADIQGMLVDGSQVVYYGRMLFGSSWYAWAMTTDLKGKILVNNTWGNADGLMAGVAKWNADYVFLMSQSGNYKFLYANSALGSWGSTAVDVSSANVGGLNAIAKHPTEANSFYVSGQAKPPGRTLWVDYYGKYDVGGSRSWWQTRDERTAQALAVGDGMLWLGTIGDTYPATVNPAKVIRANLDGSGSKSTPSCGSASKCSGVVCNDGLACTLDTCNAATGCVYTPNNGLCDDSNMCTADTCDAVKGCLNTDNGSAACDDKNPCTTDSCDPVAKCSYAANTAPCDDGNACTVGDTCGGKSCLAGAAKNCEDGIACTSHSCDTKTGCKQTPNNTKCDDAKPCTTDTCDVAKGCTYAADTKLCDDANVCTDDSCDNKTGCAHAANAALCDDGNACTVADACKSSSCKPGTAKVCDDNKECTSDSCDPASGCKVSNKSGGTSCTPSTSCSATATCGGDGNCYDGLSKYWVYHVADNNGGGFKTHTSVSQPSDGGGPVFTYNSDNNTGVGNFVRVNNQGQNQFDVTSNQRLWWGVRCSPWNSQNCKVFGRSTANSSAIAEDHSFGDGSKKGEFSVTWGSTQSIIVDAAFINQGPTTYAGFGQSGSNVDAFVVTDNGNQALLTYAGGGDDRATGLLIDTKNGSWAVGYTNSKGGGGYDAWYAGIGNPEFNNNTPVTNVTTYGGSGDEQFYGVISYAGAIWAVGTAPVNGQTTPIAVRISGGSQIVKSYPSMWGAGEVGVASDGANLLLAGVRGDIAKLDANLDIIWQNSYPKSPINVAYHSIAWNGTAGTIVIGGGGYNGQTGKSSVVIGRLSPDGLTNCTDKNACAALPTGGCDDKVACTADVCDVKQGCLHTPVDAMCDDGNPCTLNQCDGVKGCVYPQNNNVPCSDNKPCTVDSCDIAAAKCVFKLDPAMACADGNNCTDDLCDGNGNCAHNNANCDDGKVCTIDSCDSAKGGCQHALIYNAPCDDGDYCTIYETCGKAGVLTEGKCTPVGDICQQAVTPVFHAHSAVPSSLVINGGKIDAWYQIEAAVGNSAKGFNVPQVSKPVIAKGGIFGRDGIDTASTGMRLSVSLNGAFTTVVAVRTTGIASGSDVVRIGGKAAVRYFDGKLNLMLASFNGDYWSEVPTANIPWQDNKSYLLMVRVDAKEARLMAYAGGAPLVSSKVTPAGASLTGPGDLTLNKASSNNADSNAVFGEVLFYDKALTDAEMLSLATKLQLLWGLSPCTQDSDCNDGNPCTNDFCAQYPDPTQPRDCVFQGLTIPSPGSCKDNNPCTIEEVCDKGACVGSKPFVCDDGKPCTKDSCDPIKGCGAVVDNSLSCEDGDKCTDDKCSDGACNTSIANCDDQNPCTDDSCDKAIGCIHAANSAPCGAPSMCVSGGLCKNKVCEPQYESGTPCNDQNPCTDKDTCDNGGCKGGAPKVCPDVDGNPCTEDVCSIYVGCKPGPLKLCADSNSCTDDYCDLKTGQCVFKPNQGQCNDGNKCTSGDICSGGLCQPGAAVNCDDGSPCTADACSPTAGCTYQDLSACEDGDWCTVDDFCVFGVCLSGGPKNCDDGNACTLDWCEVGGCKNDAMKMFGTTCSDGDYCTDVDVCKFGACVPGKKICDLAVSTLEDSYQVKSGFVDGKYSTWKEAPPGTLRNAMSTAQNSPNADGSAKVVRFFVSGRIVLVADLWEMTKPLTVDVGNESVIIDGDLQYAGFSTYAALTLKGLQLQHMYEKPLNSYNGFWDRGSAVSSQGGAVTIKDCTFLNCVSPNGGAIYVRNADLTMSSSVMMLCGTEELPSASTVPALNPYYERGGAVSFVNTVPNGVKQPTTTAIIDNVRFDYPVSNGLGAAVLCGKDTKCFVTRSSVFGAQSHAGAIAVLAGGEATLANVTLTVNTGFAFGTAIQSKGTLNLLHTTVGGNDISPPSLESSVPAVYVNGKTLIANSILAQNGTKADAVDCLAGPGAAVSRVSSTIVHDTQSSPSGPDGPPSICGKPSESADNKLPNLTGQSLATAATSPAPVMTRTMDLMLGSKAIDKGNLFFCQQPVVGVTDQLGQPRLLGNGCDRGAWESPSP